MELRDLLYVDIESVTATQAQQVASDVIAVLSKGGLTGSEQDQSKALMVTAKEMATGRKIGDSNDNIREEVLQKIKEAEEPGDERTARYLAESVRKADVAAVDLAEQKLTDVAHKFIEDDIAASEACQKLLQNHLCRISNRKQSYLNSQKEDYR